MAMSVDKKMPEYKKNSWLDKAKYRSTNRKWLDYSSQIARRILAVINSDQDLSQAQLAKKLNVTPQHISKIVKGQENLTLETIAKISDALGVELISFPSYAYSVPADGPRVVGCFSPVTYSRGKETCLTVTDIYALTVSGMYGGGMCKMKKSSDRNAIIGSAILKAEI